jgi:hypothetical protein
MTLSTAPAGQFTLSIEPVEGAVFVHGFHLGTIEKVARDCAADIFANRNNYGSPTRTVALIRDGKLFDVFDGTWSSQQDWPDFEAEEYTAGNGWDFEEAGA